jgi:hypothetical protein
MVRGNVEGRAVVTPGDIAGRHARLDSAKPRPVGGEDVDAARTGREHVAVCVGFETIGQAVVVSNPLCCFRKLPRAAQSSVVAECRPTTPVVQERSCSRTKSVHQARTQCRSVRRDP